MLLHFLALLLCAVTLGKILFVLLYPEQTQAMTKKTITWIRGNYVISQIISIAAIVIFGVILTALSNLNTLIASGWFWSSVYTAVILPVYFNKNMEKLIATMLTESKMQQHFKLYLILTGGVAFACLLALLDPSWMFMQ